MPVPDFSWANLRNKLHWFILGGIVIAVILVAVVVLANRAEERERQQYIDDLVCTDYGICDQE
jgi:hypothetical protein